MVINEILIHYISYRLGSSQSATKMFKSEITKTVGPSARGRQKFTRADKISDPVGPIEFWPNLGFENDYIKKCYDIRVASQAIVTCIRSRGLGCTKDVLDGACTSKDAVLSKTLILEIRILNKFCSRLSRSQLIFIFL